MTLSNSSLCDTLSTNIVSGDTDLSDDTDVSALLLCMKHSAIPVSVIEGVVQYCDSHSIPTNLSLSNLFLKRKMQGLLQSSSKHSLQTKTFLKVWPVTTGLWT